MTYLDTRGAAEHLGLSPHTLNRWRSQGVGPRYCTFGAAVRYARWDLDVWAAQQVSK